MATELDHIIEIKEMVAAQGSTMTHLLGKLDDHVQKDHDKFSDLYKKAGESEKFQARARGLTKGVTAGVGLVGLLSGAIAKAKGLW